MSTDNASGQRPEGVHHGAATGAEAAVLYCHCAYAKVVPTEVRDEVLRGLAASGTAFEAVPDLCEMSARKDPALARFAGCGKLKIAACFPRAVHWLFHAAGSPLPDVAGGQVEILNMRTRPADEIVARALAPDVEATPFVEPREELRELEQAAAATEEAAVRNREGGDA